MIDDDPQPRTWRILLLATTGGFTHAGKRRCHTHPLPVSPGIFHLVDEDLAHLSDDHVSPGFIHSHAIAPILDIGAVLASRGHQIEFATNTGQASWTSDYPFITEVHDVGPPIPEDLLESHYERMRLWRPEYGMGSMMASKRLFDAAWAETYARLRALVLGGRGQATPSSPSDEEEVGSEGSFTYVQSLDDEGVVEDQLKDAVLGERGGSGGVDFIIADFFAEAAARDIQRQFSIPIAVVWPQMPYTMAPASYISGEPGFQVEAASSLTSEHASLLSRFRNETFVFWVLPQVIAWLFWTKQMRTASGLDYTLPMQTKPDYLVLVNSFFGLETPKDLPPLMAAVGPILRETYPPLDEALSEFLREHDQTIYVSLGTHVYLPTEDIVKLLRGLLQSLSEGYINGVVWSIPLRARSKLDETALIPFSPPPTADNGSASLKSFPLSTLLDNRLPRFFITPFAPQRAVLEHPHTILFLTHGGGSSANEAAYHGVPVLTIPFFFDQLANSSRLCRAGVGLSLDKMRFSPDDISASICTIVADRRGTLPGSDQGKPQSDEEKTIGLTEQGPITQNVRRLKRIARIASRRKHFAADLVEEVMYDHHLRPQNTGQPMHLQTADMRMPIWKARNWDMWLVGLSGAAVLGVTAWWTVRHAWRHGSGAISYLRD